MNLINIMNNLKSSEARSLLRNYDGCCTPLTAETMGQPIPSSMEVLEDILWQIFTDFEDAGVHFTYRVESPDSCLNVYYSLETTPTSCVIRL